MAQAQTKPAGSGPPAGPDAAGHHSGDGASLSYLAKMSGTGSAYGQTDYSAISPLAVCAVMFAFLGFLALAFPLFVIASAISLFLGGLAIHKIRNSNGAESGIPLAGVGIAIALVVGGVVVARQMTTWSQQRQYTRKSSEVIGALADSVIKAQNSDYADAPVGTVGGAAVAELTKFQNYDYAYDNLMTRAFCSKFDRKTFRRAFQVFQRFSNVGNLQSYQLTDQPILFEPIVNSDAMQAKFIAVAHFANWGEYRQPFILNNVDGEWKIDAMPQFFEVKKKGQPENQ